VLTAALLLEISEGLKKSIYLNIFTIMREGKGEKRGDMENNHLLYILFLHQSIHISPSEETIRKDG
jgi:hypothetical protein